MTCPECGGLLAPGPRPRCGACRSSWYPAGALRLAVDAEIAAGRVPDIPLPIGRRVAAPGASHEPPRPCPVCARPMDKMNYEYDSNILVDRCAACEGLWIDDQRLAAIAAYSKSNPVVIAPGADAPPGPSVGDLAREAGDAAALLNPAALALRLPLATTAPAGTGARSVAVLIAVDALVHLLVRPSGPARAELLDAWALVPARFFSGHALYAAATSMFLHSSLPHLAGNMYFLWLFGRGVEGSLGEARFWRLYLVSGLTAGVAQAAMAPASTVPILGASGAISGVLGAHLRLFPDATVEVPITLRRRRTLSTRAYLGLWFAFQLYAMFREAAAGTSAGVAFAAHVSGFALGFWMTEVK